MVAANRWQPTEFCLPLGILFVFSARGRPLTGVGDRQRRVRGAEARRRQRVIAAMRRVHALAAFFLDVRDFAVRRDLTVLSGYAAAGERREPEQPYKTHHGAPPPSNGSAIPVPLS